MIFSVNFPRARCRMIVCSCNVLSDHAIRDAAAGHDGDMTVSDIYRKLGRCDGQCRRCARTIREVLNSVERQPCDGCPDGCRHPMLEAAE